MPVLKDGFSKVSIADTLLIDPSNPRLLHVESPHALIQSVGYIKHNAARSGIYGVYFRGQRNFHPTLRPTLYRGLQKVGSCGPRNQKIISFIKRVRKDNKALRDVDDYTLEPLLQHYGFKTRWIDAVDNIWVALWFACHRVRIWGRLGEYLYFERREPEKEPEDKRYAYVLLISCSHNKARKYQAGLTGNRFSELIDLRYSVPSYFIRPHAQHGVLIRKLHKDNGTDLDFMDLVEGVIRISLSDALKWLGESKTFEVHSLFPPPVLDTGYQQILQLAGDGNQYVGSVQHIGP